MNYFQKKLTQIMQEKNLKQSDIAEMAKLSQTTISKWLRMETLPRVRSIEPLAKALNLTVGDLIGDFGNNTNLSDDDRRFICLPPKRKKFLLKFLDFIDNEKA